MKQSQTIVVLKNRTTTKAISALSSQEWGLQTASLEALSTVVRRSL